MSTVAPETLPTPLKAGWGVGSLGTVTVINVQSLLLLYFMTAVLGIAPALAGTLLFATKVVDAVLAPAVGLRSDRTVSRMGRRRPFMLAGALVCGVAIAITFNPPEGVPPAPYVAGGLLLLALGYSLFNVPYLAMPAEMTSSPAERTSLMSWRIGFISAGSLLSAFAPLLARAAGGGRTGYGIAGLAVAVFVAATMLVSVRASRSAFAQPTQPAAAGQATGLARFRPVLANRPFMLILAAKVLQLVGLASISASLLFMVIYVIGGGEGLVAVYGATAGIVSILSMPLWVALGKRATKKALYIVACLGFAAVTLTWLLSHAGEPALVLGLRGALAGLFSGGLLLMGQSMIPDAIDYDCRRSGERREGIYTGAYSFVEKASMALGPLLVGAILQSFGFVARPGAEQTAEALEGILVGAAILPAACYALSVIPLFAYDLDKRLRLAAAEPAE
jgi:glycoside/pentoside/hexuronide:cation symporter, GPH family